MKLARLIHLVVDDFNDLKQFNLACNLIGLLSERKEMSVDEISRELKVNLGDLEDILKKLIKKGLIKSSANDIALLIAQESNDMMLDTI